MSPDLMTEVREKLEEVIFGKPMIRVTLGELLRRVSPHVDDEWRFMVDDLASEADVCADGLRALLDQLVQVQQERDRHRTRRFEMANEIVELERQLAQLRAERAKETR